MSASASTSGKGAAFSSCNMSVAADKSTTTTPSASGDQKLIKIYQISVTDQGNGMSEETVARLFDPFLTTKAGELKKGRGTGIGLAICKEIVRLHGGSIQCSSTLGVGTTFTVNVPLEVITVNSPYYSLKKALAPALNEVYYI